MIRHTTTDRHIANPKVLYMNQEVLCEYISVLTITMMLLNDRSVRATHVRTLFMDYNLNYS